MSQGDARLWIWSACAVALALVAVALIAQGPPVAAGRIQGSVLDAKGQPVAGALVSLSRNGAQSRLSITRADGTYSFGDLEIGADYELRAGHNGLASRANPVRIANDQGKIDLVVVPPIRFQDVSRQSGLTFVLQNGAAGHFYPPEIMLGGVAALDYNNDGCTDIFVANGAELPSGVKTGPQFHNRLFRNNCNMTFTDVTEQAGLSGEGYSMGAAAADYDNDGFVDLFVTGLTHNTLYRNRGDGTFEDVTQKTGIGALDKKYGSMWSVSAGWFDYDNDGYLDLFVSSYVAWEPVADQCWMEGRVIFYCHPRMYKPLPNRLFHNDGKGGFIDVSESSGIAGSLGKGMGVAFGDFNGDGLTDIFVSNDSVPNFLFENLGGGKFKEVALEKGVAYAAHGNAIAGMGVDFRDLDDDGQEDIVLDGMYFDTFPLYRNLGNPKFFTDETASSGIESATHDLTAWGLGMFDFDNDGHKDLFFAASHFPGSGPRGRPNAELPNAAAALPNHVLRNTGNRRFEDVSALAGPDFQIPAMHHGAAFADFDNDGRVDVVVSAIGSNIRLFRNVSPDPGHWIALRLTGSRSNRDGLGAAVRVTLPSGAVLYNRATTAVGYASSSEPIVRFGLGPYEVAKEIQIRWPSGRRQVLREISAGRLLNIKEPLN
jgi:enediyne biosynthesis protein E4